MNLSTPEHLAAIDHLLTTTRSVRKRLDLARPVEPEVIEKCLDLASQAPTGGNQQGWHFMVVTDAKKRKRISELYGESWFAYAGDRASSNAAVAQEPSAQMKRVIGSAQYLAENMHKVPVLIIGCINGRVEEQPPMSQAGLYGSILPAVWSLMMALRARGLGSAWTTLHIKYEKEVAELLGIPDHVTQAALLPVAYFTGEDFKPAKRTPIEQMTYWDSWGTTR